VDVGIGLPATIPGVEGTTVVEWARLAEDAGFDSVGVIDRLVYPNYEPLIALAAATAVTKRIRLATTVLLAPLRANAALLAKQAASVDRLSEGRLVLGVGLGARDDDFTASGLSTKGRGRTLDRQLEEMKRIWGGEERGYAGAIGPGPARPGGPELIVGGHVEASFKRAARFANGWIMGGGPPEQFAQLAPAVDEAWRAEGREGKPRKLSLAYYALGPQAKESADWYLHDYYGWLGPIADHIAAGAATSEEMVKSYAAAFEQNGCDELIFFPCSGDHEQVQLLKQALG
jgi:alkanesulfonate monooxygenase SsuD/methylene tetrahydromethanopterin reductase-like flavin-dependent oxidoreductase (luciferase family)